MHTEWTLRPIRADEADEGKRLVYGVAHALMEPQMPLQDFIAQWVTWDILGDMTDVQTTYWDNIGVFLVAVDGGRMVGTGAIHQTAERPGVCDVRRIALLPEYRGRGLGYALMLELRRRALDMGYHTMLLWTNRFKLTRAVAFYRQLGFVEVAHADAYEDEIWMEWEISPANR